MHDFKLRKRAPKFTRKETELLINAMSSRKELSANIIGGQYQSQAAMKQGWQEVASIVNALGGGPLRTTTEVKRKWRDLKYRIKKKHFYLNRLKMANQRCAVEELTASEKKLLGLVSQNTLKSHFDNSGDTSGEFDHEDSDKQSFGAPSTSSKEAIIHRFNPIQTSENTEEEHIEPDSEIDLTEAREEDSKPNFLEDFIKYSQPGPSTENSIKKSTKNASSTQRVRLHRERKRIMEEDQSDMKRLIGVTTGILNEFKRLNMLKEKKLRLYARSADIDFDDL